MPNFQSNVAAHLEAMQRGRYFCQAPMIRGAVSRCARKPIVGVIPSAFLARDLDFA
jgi:hypothetical protein